MTDPADRAAALALTPVSRETEARLDALVALLLTWQRSHNLIAPSTVPQVWTRHVADSLQLLPLAPGARVWLDLGSGGGFPGLVIGCALVEREGGRITLVESDSRKAAFLREAGRSLSLPVTVQAERIDAYAARNLPAPEIVTARALAPLPRLLPMVAPFLDNGAQGLFPKGQDVEVELTEASKSWNIEADLIPSLTSPSARIVVVRSAKPIDRP